MAVKIQVKEVKVFWVDTRSVVVGYQCFGGPCCLHLHWSYNPEDLDLDS